MAELTFYILLWLITTAVHIPVIVINSHLCNGNKIINNFYDYKLNKTNILEQAKWKKKKNKFRSAMIYYF